MKMISALVFFLMAVLTISAQDNHYNSQQFGARATLLGGSVVGGLEDNSSMFYNPAALVFTESNNLTIHTNAHSVEFVLLKNGLGDNVKSFSLRYIPMPQEISAVLTYNPQKKLRFGYIILNKGNNNNDFSQRKSYNADLTSLYEGEEYFVGQLDMQNNITERWAGVCGSYRISEKFSYGLTSFASYRNQRYLYNLYSMLSSGPLEGNQDVAYQRYYDAMRLNVISLFLKGGLHFRSRNWRVGLTFTTPSIRVWGDAKVDRNISFFGLDRNNIVYDDRQWYIPGYYKQPFNVALGIMNVTNYYRLCLSATYHNGIKDYRMADALKKEVAHPTIFNDGIIDFLGFMNSADPVLNVSWGMEYKLADKLKFLSGLRTDFATQRKKNTIDIDNLENPRFANPIADLYHISFGISFRTKHSVFTAGATYSLGFANEVMQHADFSNPVYPVNLWGTPKPEASLRHHTATITFGYTYFFDGPEMEKKKWRY